MINIKQAKTIDGKVMDLAVHSEQEMTIDATGLMLFPGLIDPHVHFRVPGLEHKEDWCTGARAAIAGGYTTVFDMPNTIPPAVTAERLYQKKQRIDAELKSAGIPLRYELYFGTDHRHFSEIHQVKNDVIGIKIFMGESTGNLVLDDEGMHAAFAIAATQNLLVAVHAEDATRIAERALQYKASTNYCDHSNIRDPEAAALAVQKAIALARWYGVRLYILHVSTSNELALIKEAKEEGLPVYAETTPHHLFLDETVYDVLHGRALVNPPLRGKHHQQALWQAIFDGVIDTIGSDHAPHLPHEKEKPYGGCPCGMPGIETTLPLLLTAAREERLSLEKILYLTYHRPREIFQLPKNDDIVLVDMQTPRTVIGASLKTKCAWSPFEGRVLTGWPKCVVVNGQYVSC
ncbi:MAG: dihydroorotase [Gammaproteobacteria bacterium RIFCSPHIGHO2_12_FULL_42_10]|nr:MAG: dihydroorotase [Gammaproteobacteria bacterium RIFCSPHIGHO2_12_FULL_42_10]